jgi:hypothetical protein
MPLSAEKISRRTFIGSLAIAAASIASSAVNRDIDPSCYIRGSRKRKNPIDLPKMMECTFNDPLIRLSTASVIAFAAGITWLRGRN